VTDIEDLTRELEENVNKYTETVSPLLTENALLEELEIDEEAEPEIYYELFEN